MDDKCKTFTGPANKGKKKSEGNIQRTVTKGWDMDMVVVNEVDDKIDQATKR